MTELVISEADGAWQNTSCVRGLPGRETGFERIKPLNLLSHLQHHVEERARRDDIHLGAHVLRARARDGQEERQTGQVEAHREHVYLHPLSTAPTPAAARSERTRAAKQRAIKVMGHSFEAVLRALAARRAVRAADARVGWRVLYFVARSYHKLKSSNEARFQNEGRRVRRVLPTCA